MEAEFAIHCGPLFMRGCHFVLALTLLSFQLDEAFFAGFSCSRVFRTVMGPSYNSLCTINFTISSIATLIYAFVSASVGEDVYGGGV